MKKYEYLWLGIDVEEIEKLDAYGVEGWRVVQLVPNTPRMSMQQPGWKPWMALLEGEVNE